MKEVAAPENLDPYNPTKYEYDAAGRIERVTHPVVNLVEASLTIDYDDLNGRVTVTDENGRESRYHFDSLRRPFLVEALGPDGVSVANSLWREYGWQNQITTIIDLEDEKIWQSDYDALGRVTRQDYPGDHYVEVVYDDLANTRTMTVEGWETSGSLAKTVYVADDYGRVVEVREFVDPESPTDFVSSFYEYDLSGNLMSVTDARGQETTHLYDDLNRLATTTYPDGTTETYSYFDDGALDERTSRGGTVMAHDYDALGRLWHVTVPEAVVIYGYDGNGNVVSISNQHSSLSMTYDARDRMETETLGLGGPAYTFTYEYDKAENVKQIGYPGNFQVSYDYDDTFYLVDKVNWGFGSPSEDSITLFYDDGERLDHSRHESSGSWLESTYSYDETGRLSGIRTYTGSDPVRRSVALRPEAPHSEQWCQEPYEGPGMNFEKVNEEVRDDGDYVFATRNELDASPSGHVRDSYRMSGITLGENEEITSVTLYMWARVTESQGEGGPALLSFDINYGSNTYPPYYFHLGTRYTRYSYEFKEYPGFGGGKWTEEQVDSLRVGLDLFKIEEGEAQVSQVWAVVETETLTQTVELLHLTYDYYEHSQVEFVTDQIRGVTEEYHYDGLGRLTDVADRWAIHFDYDEVGNRLTMVEDGITTGYTYDFHTDPGSSYSKLETWEIPGTEVTDLYYDTAGEGFVERRHEVTATEDVWWDFEYDSFDRLTTEKKDGLIVGWYEYDALGRRVVAESSPDYRHVAFLGSSPGYEKDIVSNPTLERWHVYVGGVRLAVVQSSSTQFQFSDPLGSTRLVIEYDGQSYAVVYEAAWKPFGVEAPLCEPSCDNPEKYLGKKKPGDSGLYWFGARYFDPEVGRFYSLDPVLGALSVPQTLNRYAYAANDPVGMSDPEGEFALALLGVLALLALTAFIYIATEPWGSPGFKLGVSMMPGLDTVGDAWFAWDSCSEAWGNPEWGTVGTCLADVLLAAIPFVGVGLVKAGRTVKHLDDPGAVLFSHKRASHAFPNPAAVGGARNIDELAEGLRSGDIKPSQLEPIEILTKDGVHVVTEGHRRLIAFQKAGVRGIPYVRYQGTWADFVARHGDWLGEGVLGKPHIWVRGVGLWWL